MRDCKNCRFHSIEDGGIMCNYGIPRFAGVDEAEVCAQYAEPKKQPQSVSMNADSGEKTWLTPKWIIDVLGAFEIDPCTPDGGMPWRTADRMVTKAEDGLRVDWHGKRVWLNPPYGKESVPFFKKMIDDGAQGIALVFARTDTALWQKYIFPHANCILFLAGRLRFCKQDGTQGETATAPSALIAFGEFDGKCLCDAWERGYIKGYIMAN